MKTMNKTEKRAKNKENEDKRFRMRITPPRIAMVALLIAYLPTMFTAFTEREAAVSMLEVRAGEGLLERTDRHGAGLVRIARIVISRPGADGPRVLSSGGPALFAIHLTGRLPAMSCSFTIYDRHGVPVTYVDSALHGAEDRADPEASSVFVCVFDELLLIPGRYRINAEIQSGGVSQDHVEAAAFFDVEQGALRGRPVPRDTGYGNALTPHRWIRPGS